MDKLIRFALLPAGASQSSGIRFAARHHQLYNPWLTGVQIGPDGTEIPYTAHELASPRCAAILRCRPRRHRRHKIKEVLHQFGLQNEAIGVDVIEMPVLAAFAKEAYDLVDGQQVFLERVASRPMTRSRSSPTPRPWSIPRTRSSTPSCVRG